MLHKTFISVIVALWSVLSVTAQTLSLDSCVVMALQGNRELRNAELQVQQREHIRKQYRANFFPKFSIEALDLYGNIDKSLTIDMMQVLPSPVAQTINGVTEQAFAYLVKSGILSPDQVAAISSRLQSMRPHVDVEIDNVFSGGISVEQPIYMGGKITAAYKMNRIGQQMAEQNLALSEDQVIVQTHEAFALLVKAQSLQRVALRYDSLLNKLHTDVSNAERHGLAHQNDVLKVTVKKQEAALQVLQAENAVTLARMNLCHNIGLPLDSDIKAQESQPLPEGVNTEATIAGRPELALLDLKTQMAAQQVKLDRSDFLPQLGVKANYGYTNGVKLMNERLFDRASFSIMASLKIPLYHFGEGYHKVKAAKLALERQRLEQEELTEKMHLELQQAANRLQESMSEVLITENGVKAAEANLRSSESAYRNGLATLAEHMESQTLWQQAEARHAIARTQLIVNMALYRKAAGIL